MPSVWGHLSAKRNRSLRGFRGILPNMALCRQAAVEGFARGFVQ